MSESLKQFSNPTSPPKKAHRVLKVKKWNLNCNQPQLQWTSTLSNLNCNQPQLQWTSTSIILNFNQPQLQLTSASINLNFTQP